MKKTVKRTSATGKKRVIIVHEPTYVNRPSNVTKKAPSARLKKRRAANTIKGRYPNPARGMLYKIEQIHAGKKLLIGHFRSKSIADTTANILNANAKGGARFVVNHS